MRKANAQKEEAVGKAHVKALQTPLVFIVCRRAGGISERWRTENPESAAASCGNNLGAVCWEDGPE